MERSITCSSLPISLLSSPSVNAAYQNFCPALAGIQGHPTKRGLRGRCIARFSPDSDREAEKWWWWWWGLKFNPTHTTERIIGKYEKGETARINGNWGGDILTRIERTIVIEAPVEKVFAFLTDFDNFIKLQQPEMEMEILSRDEGPQRVGYTVKARAKVRGQVWEFDFETTEFVKNKRYAGRQKGGPMKKLESRDLFEPTNGGTRWTSTVEYELPYSILGKILDKLRMRKIMEEGADYNVEKAKELLEKE